MDKTPRVFPARTVRDSHGATIGHSGGFRPDPLTGNVGLDIQLTRSARDRMRIKEPSIWVDDEHVLAIRRDEVVIDWSLEELSTLVQAHGKPPAQEPRDPARSQQPTRAA